MTAMSELVKIRESPIFEAGTVYFTEKEYARLKPAEKTLYEKLIKNFDTYEALLASASSQPKQGQDQEPQGDPRGRACYLGPAGYILKLRRLAYLIETVTNALRFQHPERSGSRQFCRARKRA